MLKQGVFVFLGIVITLAVFSFVMNSAKVSDAAQHSVSAAPAQNLN